MSLYLQKEVGIIYCMVKYTVIIRKIKQQEKVLLLKGTFYLEYKIQIK